MKANVEGEDEQEDEQEEDGEDGDQERAFPRRLAPLPSSDLLRPARFRLARVRGPGPARRLVSTSRDLSTRHTSLRASRPCAARQPCRRLLCQRATRFCSKLTIGCLPAIVSRSTHGMAWSDRLAINIQWQLWTPWRLLDRHPIAQAPAWS